MRLQSAVLFAAIMLACRSSRTEPSATNATIDSTPSGAIVTTNRAPTAWSDTSGWKLVLERVIGAGGTDPLLTPHHIVVTASGDVVVLERNPPRMVVFDPEGNPLRTIGRQGAGPGEFASGGILMVVGDTLVHHDRNQARVQRFLADGSLIDGWPAPCCTSEPTRADTLGRIAIPAATRRREEHEVPWAANGFIRFDGSGRLLDSLIPPLRPSPGTWTASRPEGGIASTQIPLATSWVHTLSPGGEWVHGNTNTYRFAFTTSGGDTLRLVEAPSVEWRVPDSVRQRLRDEIVAQNPALNAVANTADVPDVYPQWGALAIDGAGMLWVLATGVTGLGDHWLVFDPDGRWLGRVPAPFRSAVRMFWTADRLYAIVQGEPDGANEVRVYRIVREY